MNLLPTLALMTRDHLCGAGFVSQGFVNKRLIKQVHVKSNLRQCGAVVGMAWVLSGLSGCDKLKDVTQHTSSASATASTTTVARAETTAAAANDAAPVNYPFIAWQRQTVTKLPVQDIALVNQHLTQALGQTPTTDTKSLDFYSNPATQYQFAKPAMPYFDVIDSPQFIELGWYYPNAKDRAQEKQLGIGYAGQVYQLARAWLGNREGAQLVENILTGQTIRNQTINGVEIAMARCEFFSCMLVVKK